MVTIYTDSNLIPSIQSIQYRTLEAKTMGDTEDDWAKWPHPPERDYTDDVGLYGDTYEDWAKWRHPLDRDHPHPWVPDFVVPFDSSIETPAFISIRKRYSCESANYLFLMNSLSDPPTFELQDLFPNYIFSLQELHSFCGKASAMYAIADLRAKPRMEPRQRGLCGRLYGDWFNLVESNSSFETRFFTRFMQSDGLDITNIVIRHKALSQRLEIQMREPIERIVEGEGYSAGEHRQNHAECTLLSTFKDLVIIVEEQSFRADALLIILNPGLVQGIEGIEGIEKAEEDEIDGQKIIRVKTGMESIMRIVVAIQKKAAMKESGITGHFRKN